jgi:hypothetical protein
MKARVWIVEMWTGGRWETTVGAALSRAEARLERQQWCQDNPGSRFRVRLYVPAEREKDGASGG